MNQLKVNLFKAYYDARKNKRNTYNQLKFEINYEQELLKLYEEIKNKTYKVGKSIAFIINKPVKREIFAANFRDRVIHHLIFNYINPILEPQFINDSYSCRKGKGTHYGIKKANQYINEVSQNYSTDAYILKLDIKGYFMSINKVLLMQKLQKMITKQVFDKYIYENTNGKTDQDIDFDSLFILINEIISNNPTIDCTIKGHTKDWESLPDSKSLFKSNPDCGLPIGNLTSQLFSNVYLNDFDHYMKTQLGYKYYGRYVDDFFVMSTSMNELKLLIHSIHNYLKANLDLKLHPKKIHLQHYTKGIQYLGVFINPYRIYIGNRTKNKFKKCLYYLSKFLKQKKVLTFKNLNYILSVINSYLGLFSHYKTYKLRNALLFRSKPCFLYRLGYFDVNLIKFTTNKSLIINNQIHLLK